MAEVTREMILDYMQAKGGVVKNVDLVRHFRKFLQVSDARVKGTRALCTQPRAVTIVCVCMCCQGCYIYTATMAGRTRTFGAALAVRTVATATCRYM